MDKSQKLGQKSGQHTPVFQITRPDPAHACVNDRADQGGPSAGAFAHMCAHFRAHAPVTVRIIRCCSAEIGWGAGLSSFGWRGSWWRRLWGCHGQIVGQYHRLHVGRRGAVVRRAFKLEASLAVLACMRVCRSPMWPNPSANFGVVISRYGRTEGRCWPPGQPGLFLLPATPRHTSAPVLGVPGSS